MNNLSETKLSFVNPKLADKIRTLSVMLATEKIYLIVTSGLRTWKEQSDLYAQGRTTPGKIVTKAPAGYGWHEFGLAVDCAPEIIQGQIDWNGTHPQWIRMEQVGISLGLYSGSEFKSIHDDPHFQYTGRFPVTPDDEVRRIYTLGGTQAVWQEAGL